MYTDFLRHENEDIGHFIQCQAIFVCPSNGRCQDCKVYQSLFVFTVDVGIQLFCPISATYHTKILVQQRVIFIFEDALVASFDHIPHWHIWPAKPSQVKKTAGHPLFIREIIFSQSEAVWGKMWRTSEENVGHPGITQKIIFDAVRYVVEQHCMVLYGHTRKSSLTWYSM